MKLFKSKTDDATSNGGDADAGRKSRKQKKTGMFGDAGLMGLFANHGEKLFLAFALLIAAGLILTGFRSRAGIDGGKSPANLNQEADNARNHISSYTWQVHFRDDRDLNKNFKARADQTLEPVEVAAYKMPQLFKPPYMPAQTLRTDPNLLPPRNLVVRAGVGPLAAEPSGDRSGGIDRQTLGEGQRVRTAEQGKEQRWKKYVKTSGSTQGTYFASVLALVPYREQLVEYNNRLKNTHGYNEERDQPKYVDWWLQRAEFTNDGTEPEWKDIKNFRVAEREEKEWPVVADAPELIPDEKFLHKILTRPVPPLLIDDLPKYAVHELLPRELPQRETESDKRPEAEVDWGGFKGSPESSGGSVGQEGERRGARDFERGQSPHSSAEKPGGDRTAETAEFLMFRHIDLTVKPGKTYVYRLALLLDDPNDPRSTSYNDKPPPSEYLDRDVSERLLDKSKNRKTWWWEYRRTEFSDPSSPVHIPEGNRMLAGVVTPAEPTTVPGQPGSFLRLGAEPRAKVLALTFDSATGASIPGEREVSRGTFGNFAQPAEFQLPLSNNILGIDNHDFRTDSLVVDIRGGEPMGSSRLRAPGEVLILDRQGRLQVLSELDDADAYQQNYIEPEAPAVVESDRNEKRETRGRRENDRDIIDVEMRNTRRNRNREGGR